LISVIFISCGSANNISDRHSQTPERDSAKEGNSDMLLGHFERKKLEQEPFSTWFNSKYTAYTPNKQSLKTIKENISDYEITVLMGTWCPDSQEEIPKLYKILDLCGYDFSKLSAVALDEYKSTPQNLEKDLEVSRVPTIIFYKYGKEVNRFVEYPVKSFEEDIAQITSGKAYKNPYAK